MSTKLKSFSPEFSSLYGSHFKLAKDALSPIGHLPRTHPPFISALFSLVAATEKNTLENVETLERNNRKEISTS